jgi:hypothetical protein
MCVCVCVCRGERGIAQEIHTQATSSLYGMLLKSHIQEYIIEYPPSPRSLVFLSLCEGGGGVALPERYLPRLLPPCMGCYGNHTYRRT